MEVKTAPSAGRSQGRHAFCPLCGHEQPDRLANQVGSPEAALCTGRCAVAWQALTYLRSSESASERVAARRRLEWGTQQAHAPVLSELLLMRWRAGDWTVPPEQLLAQL